MITFVSVSKMRTVETRFRRGSQKSRIHPNSTESKVGMRLQDRAVQPAPLSPRDGWAGGEDLEREAKGQWTGQGCLPDAFDGRLCMWVLQMLFRNQT